MSRSPESWLDVLPLVLLGIRASLKEDLGASSSELLYGSALKLPGEFFRNSPATSNPFDFLQSLRRYVRSLRPVPTSRHDSSATFISKDLKDSSHVFLRIDRVRRPLEQPYSGPYKVLSRTEKFFQLDINGKKETISIDRLKPAYLLCPEKISFPTKGLKSEQPAQAVPSPQEQPVVTRYGRKSRPVVRFSPTS